MSGSKSEVAEPQMATLIGGLFDKFRFEDIEPDATIAIRVTDDESHIAICERKKTGSGEFDFRELASCGNHELCRAHSNPNGECLGCGRPGQEVDFIHPYLWPIPNDERFDSTALSICRDCFRAFNEQPNLVAFVLDGIGLKLEYLAESPDRETYERSH